MLKTSLSRSKKSSTSSIISKILSLFFWSLSHIWS